MGASTARDLALRSASAVAAQSVETCDHNTGATPAAQPSLPASFLSIEMPTDFRSRISVHLRSTSATKGSGSEAVAFNGLFR
eukprot:4380520-Amphidinium_carterae.1